MNLCRLITIGLVACTLSFSPKGAEADNTFLEGHFMKRACLDQESDTLSGYCLGFVSGTTNLIISTKDAMPGTWPRICVPKTVPMGVRQTVFVKYLEDHPEELHLGADVLMVTAMREAFPCDN